MAKNNKNAAPAAQTENEATQSQVKDIEDLVKEKNIISDENRIKALAKMKEQADEKEQRAYIQTYQGIEYIQAKVRSTLRKRRDESRASKDLLSKVTAILLMIGGQIEGEQKLANGFSTKDAAATIKEAGFEPKQITRVEAHTMLEQAVKDNRKKFNEIEEDHRQFRKEISDACDGQWSLDWEMRCELDRLYA